MIDVIGLAGKLLMSLDFPVFNFLKSETEAISTPIPAPEPAKPKAPEPSPSPAKLLHVGKEVITGNAFAINPEDYAKSGERDAILASSGMGKSYLAGVLTEEKLESGELVVIIDPEGENYTLAERYPMAIIGGDHANSKVDLDNISKDKAFEIAKTILAEGLPTIFDISGRSEAEQQAIFAQVAGAFFSVMDDTSIRRPIKLIVEEARVLAPQNASSVTVPEDGESSLAIFEHIATRGRKRGLHFMLATQRPASINKNILSQCNRWWFGGVQSQQDCNALKPYLADAGIQPDQLRKLQKGQFYFYTEGTTKLIQVKKRRCRHGGKTPEARKDLKIVTSKAEAMKIAGRL